MIREFIQVDFLSDNEPSKREETQPEPKTEVRSQPLQFHHKESVLNLDQYCEECDAGAGVSCRHKTKKYTR